MSGSLFLVATALSFLSANSSAAGGLLKKWGTRQTTEQRQLLDERRRLKADQVQYNMMDEFAKYSKLQRKINTIDQQLKESATNTSRSVWMNLAINNSVQLLCGLALFVLTLYYRRTPLFKLPDHMDLSPFNYLISYPNGRNYVSFHFWVMCCNVSARVLKVSSWW